jgi:hypothetical protein
MILTILLWYFIGIFAAFILLLISNTISVKWEDSKIYLYVIFFSWIAVFMLTLYIIGYFIETKKIFFKLKKFLESTPDLVSNKKKK